MLLEEGEYMKFILIIYLLGVKGLNNANIVDMFGNDPVMREEWLCQATNRHDLQRFLRQARVFDCMCELCCHTLHSYVATSSKKTFIVF